MAISGPRGLLGIMGGTFDPIHYGHLRMAHELAEGLGLQQVRFIPAAVPPHKPQPAAGADHRANMVALAVAGDPAFTLDVQELQREGPSYTITTLLQLRQEVGPETALCLLMGSDAFVHLDSWHRWQELLLHCHIVLVQRPGQQLKTALSAPLHALMQQHYSEDAQDLQQQPAGCISMRQVTALDISATRIRQALQDGLSPRYLLPDSVLDYIRQHRLYLG